MAPSRYLNRIEQKGQVDSEVLDSYLTTHWINVSACRTDDFDRHIIHRAESILNAIEKAMGKTLMGRDSEEVERLFGENLV